MSAASMRARQWMDARNIVVSGVASGVARRSLGGQRSPGQLGAAISLASGLESKQ